MNNMNVIAQQAEQLAAANALIASKDALLEQAREALWKLKDYAKDSNDCQYGTLSASLVARIADEALAAIERHLKGEES